MNLNDLNIAQRKAVEAMGGPILIFAGAGSGKTRVLTYKIAYLIEEVGLPPEKILAVTFTNKAANEMKERVSRILSVDTKKMNVGTFHSICARMLRFEIPRLGYTRDFGIYDQADSRSLVKEIIQRLNLDTKTFTPNAYQNLISGKKNQMLSPENVTEYAEGYVDEKLAQIYTEYQLALKRNNALDFDDLLLLPIQLFKENPDRLAYYQNQYQYVLVDEYQDTNRPQFELVHSISEKHRDICVVGDDDQSIYGWRGADIKNILEFSEVFGESTIIKLEQNYRSTKTILKAAHAVVSLNENRSEKELWTDNDLGDKIQIQDCHDERDEAKRIVSSIDDIKNDSFKFSEHVILYRTNAQSRSIEDELRREAIPYQIIGGVKFYDRKEVKDVLAYLRLIVNPCDSVSFDRVVNFPPRGIGKTSLDKFKEFAKLIDLDLIKALERVEEVKIGPKQKASLAQFRDMIKSFTAKIESESAKEISIDLVNEIQLSEHYANQNSIEAKERWSNVDELLNSISEFTENSENNNLRIFLEEVSLLTDIDRHNKSDDSVTLMTIHSAKGLEYPIVHISGLEEGLFPLGSLSNPDMDLEEERRLFYVAITRAEQKAFLYNAAMRRRFGGEPIPSIASQFIGELPDELVEHIHIKILQPKNATYSQKFNYNKSVPVKQSSQTTRSSYQQGMIVKHSIFGKGKLLNIDGVGENAKLTILFSGNVKKTLIQKYANLTVLESV
jgi:DNA helicase II / ATP-dependent DNA helicase PcrA